MRITNQPAVGEPRGACACAASKRRAAQRERNMGSIFAKLRAESISKVVLDFERPVDPEQLTPECRETYAAIAQCVDLANDALRKLTDYTDLKPTMKVVMDMSRVNEHKQALEDSMGRIVDIQDFHRLADRLNEEVPKLLNFIKSDSLKDQEALCQIFTRLLDRVLMVSASRKACGCGRACVRACVRACARACVRACVHTLPQWLE